MIDFRYHLVSLVAVFIALAVGIALGAGPLREGLGSTLEGEVSQLREERADLRAQVDDATRIADAKEQAIEVLATAALPQRLEGVRVGLVILPGADRNTSTALENHLEEAGADVVLTAEVDNRAADVDPPTERLDLLASLGETLDDPEPVPVDGGSAEPGAPTAATILAAVLAGADAPGHVGAWLTAATALEGEGLLDLTWTEGSTVEITDRRPPDVLLVESGGLTAESSQEAPGADRLQMRLDLVRALGALDRPVVVTGTGGETIGAVDTDTIDPLVTAVREDDDLRGAVSTVDNLESVAGQVAAVLATAWELDGEAGHYGIDSRADAALPLVPPVRIPLGQPGTGGTQPPGPTPTAPVPDDATATTSAP